MAADQTSVAGNELLPKGLWWPSVAAQRWVASFAARTCADPATAALVLIGSIARGGRQTLDVDLLYVYWDRPVDVRDHPLDVDIRAYSATEVLERVSRAQDVISWSLRFGRLICEHRDFWSELKREWHDKLPLPDASVAEERAKRAMRIHQQLLEMGDADAALEQRITLLTHLAWARLLRAGIHPASRPELIQQLQKIGETALADDLANTLHTRAEQAQGAAVSGTMS